MNRVLWTLCAVAAVALGSTGCNNGPGYPVGQVKGTLLLKGKPVNDNVELFLMNHQTGFAYKAKVGEAGAFKVEEPVRVGDYVAYVQPAVDVNLDMDGAPTPVTAVAKIPRKYTNDVGSDLKISVAEGENVVEFDMK